MEKHIEYAAKINGLLGDLFDEENENFIGVDELKEGRNIECFFHALANVAPTFIYNALSEYEVNLLEFNHIANVLCFKFLKNINPPSKD